MQPDDSPHQHVTLIPVHGDGDSVTVQIGEKVGRKQLGDANLPESLFAIQKEANGGLLLVSLTDDSKMIVRGDNFDIPLWEANSVTDLPADSVVWLLGDSLPYRVMPPKTVEAPPLKRARSEKGSWKPSEFKFYRTPVALQNCDNAGALDLRPLFSEEGIEMVLLTTYELDVEWIVSVFPVLTRVPVSVVSQSAPSRVPANWSHVSPKMLQWGTCHGKLMILFFPEKVRVIVTSANHIESDHFLKANSLWTQEFALATSNVNLNSKNIGYSRDFNDFGPVLLDYLRRCGVATSVMSRLSLYDYSTAAVALVTTVPGDHVAENRICYGYRRLTAVLKEENVLGDSRGTVVVQCSSLGSLSAAYLDKFAKSLGGGSSGPFAGNKTALEIVWPSSQFVRESVPFGWSAGGSICFNQRNNKEGLKKALRSKYVGVPERQHIAPHFKCMFRVTDANARTVAWFYTGSHNLSKSAWGEMQKNDAQNHCPSFELGIVLLPPLLSRRSSLQEVRLVLSQGNRLDKPEIGTVILPIPFVYPAPSYSATHSGPENLDDMPWAWDVAHNEHDILGATWPGVHMG